MRKEIASGIMILGGAALLVTGAEIAAPAVAALGAVASLGAGLYQAVSSPGNKQDSKKEAEYAGPRARV